MKKIQDFCTTLYIVDNQHNKGYDPQEHQAFLGGA